MVYEAEEVPETVPIGLSFFLDTPCFSEKQGRPH